MGPTTIVLIALTLAEMIATIACLAAGTKFLWTQADREDDFRPPSKITQDVEPRVLTSKEAHERGLRMPWSDR